MKIKNLIDKTKSGLEKIGKKNIVVICSVLLIGCAIWLNWSLISNAENDAADPKDAVSSGGDSVSSAGNTTGDDAYFAASLVSRQRARDEAMEVLQGVVENADATETVKNQALGDISRIALDIEREGNIETLIKAKGFEDCVAVVSGTTANIIVKSEGLLQSDIAQITEIVYEQAGIDPANIRIVEKK